MSASDMVFKLDIRPTLLMAFLICVAEWLARLEALWQLWHLLANKAEPLAPPLELEELELEELELEELLEVDTGSGGSMVPV